MKRCSRCKETKEIGAFNIASERKDGRYPYCRECVSSYRKEKGINLYSYNPESRREGARRYRAQHKWYEQKFRPTYLKTVEGKASKLLAGAKRRSKSKNIEFDLDYEWVLEKLSLGKCEASGLDFDYTVPDNQKHGDFVPSIDRIDNLRGYTKDNCWMVCLMINRAKSQGPWENVVIMAKGIVNKLNENIK